MLRLHVVSNDSTVFLYDARDVAQIFGGRYTEVRNFCRRAAQFCDVTVSVITSRGLITSPKEIEKYSDVTDSKEAYICLENKFPYAEKLWEVSQGCDVTALFVPKEMLRIIIEKAPECIVVSAANKCFQEEFFRRNWHYFERRGARIGKQNTEDILRILQNYNSDI